MQIGSTTNTLATMLIQKNGNSLPIERKTSSIEELDAYFEQKISFLEDNGHDTSNVLALRDAIREAAENKSGDSPSLPTVKEHPYGGKYLVNMHISFGTEVKGELKDLTKKIEHLNVSNNLDYGHLQNLAYTSSNNSSPGKLQNSQIMQDNSSIRELAKTIDPSNMSRNEARAIASALGLSNDLTINNAFALQSMVLVNENGNLRTATETDAIMNEKYNMFDAIENSIEFHKSKGQPTGHLEDALKYLDKLKTYRENPEVNVYT